MNTQLNLKYTIIMFAAVITGQLYAYQPFIEDINPYSVNPFLPAWNLPYASFKFHLTMYTIFSTNG